MARVLRPGGWLALAYPGPEHLIELRDRFGLLRQHGENSGGYADMVTRFVGQWSVTQLHRRALLDPATARAAILMGPNARHVDPSILDVGPYPLAVTFDINLLYLLKRNGFTILEVPTEWTDKVGSKVALGKTSFTMLLSVIRLRWIYSWLSPLRKLFFPIENWLYRKLNAPTPNPDPPKSPPPMPSAKQHAPGKI